MLTKHLIEPNRQDLATIWQDAQAQQTEFLDLSRNSFTHLDFGSSPILESLKVIDASYNKQTIQEVVLDGGKFPQLQHVYLYLSNIQRIVFKGTFPHLETLHLANNQLTEFVLPDGSFPKLQTLYLYENPITNLDREIFDKKQENVWEDVRIYLESVGEGKETDFVHQAKMILIGNGEVGKSSIRIRLLNKKAPLPKQEDRTEGLDIVPYKIKKLKPSETKLDHEIDFTVNIWDFGGQGKYREVQQLFCSRKSLYIFVTAFDDDPEKNEHYIGWKYWLSMARAFGYDKDEDHNSPVIHVANKIDKCLDGNYEVNANEKKAIFPEIKTFVQISCTTLTNFSDFEQKIRLHLSDISADVFTSRKNKNWLTVKNALEEKCKNNINHITKAEYLVLCNENNMTNEQAESWLKNLHDIGTVIHFGENELLKNWVILNPIWVKEALYNVLNSTLIENGVFRESYFPTVWNQYALRKKSLFDRILNNIKGKKDYTSEEHQHLLQLMLAYKFCYPTQDRFGELHYIIPALLYEKEPLIEAYLQIYDVELCFDYKPFIPAGTVNKLMVDLREKIYGEYKWKNNVILHDPDSNGYAHIREDWENGKVYVCIRNRPDVMYPIVKSALEGLNNDLKRTKYMKHLEFEVSVKYKSAFRTLQEIRDFGKIAEFPYLFPNEPIKQKDVMTDAQYEEYLSKIPPEHIEGIKNEYEMQWKVRLAHLKRRNLFDYGSSDYLNEQDSVVKCDAKIEQIRKDVPQTFKKSFSVISDDLLTQLINRFWQDMTIRIQELSGKVDVANLKLDQIQLDLAAINKSIDETNFETNPQDNADAEALLQRIMSKLEEQGKKAELLQIEQQHGIGGKLKASIPLIPGFLSYEFEVKNFDIKTNVQHWKKFLNILL